ncbi:hypothetical protein MTR67_008924 [Solanum verrucosum]|uniref:RNase H type-1 domain-containing protein n=1 Tax=Solanum verrucosum TaxID=315347 RepID=A0AAF0Q2A8_SOLVR|nr:hypothetical protein MTR67_008924 [Solanum verrucosum]
MAFSSPIQCDSNLEAEALAAKYGLSRCTLLNYRDFTLEVDSLSLVQMISENKCYNYKLLRIIEEVQHLKKLANVKVEHYFREVNTIANHLAKLALSNHNEAYYDTYQQLLMGARGHSNLTRTKCLL